MVPRRNTPRFDTFVADELARQADEITDQWLDQLTGTLGVHRSLLLPGREMRHHIPEIIRGVAEFLRTPIKAARTDVIERLRLHAELRREQGYDIQQLLTEFEELSRLVFRCFTAAVRSYPGTADPAHVADLASRLREGLAEITSDAVGMYRHEELEQRRDLAKRLAEFARTIAHELKNPLGAAQAGTEMLREGPVAGSEEERDRFTRLVLRNLVRVNDLIDDIRALAVSEDAQGVERWAALGTVVEKIFDELRESAAAKGVRLEVDGTLPDIEVDAVRVEIALINLVGNAVKYSDPDKDERWVRVGAEEVEPDEPDEPAAGRWKIKVQDNGLGIPREFQNSVFQRHFRAHPDRAEGTGLGLAITHEVVTQRGGAIWFESREGEGTTFYLVIPERKETGEPPESDTRS